MQCCSPVYHPEIEILASFIKTPVQTFNSIFIVFSYFSLLVLLHHVKMEEPASRVINTLLANVSVNKVSWENFARKVMWLYSSYSVKNLFLKVVLERHFFHPHVILLFLLCPACSLVLMSLICAKFRLDS